MNHLKFPEDFSKRDRHGGGRAYWWPCIVKGTHCNFEASSFCNQDVLFWYSHVLEGDASGIRTSLTHVQLLQEKLVRYQATLRIIFSKQRLKMTLGVPFFQSEFQECQHLQ